MNCFEVNKLFKLLEQFYPKAKQVTSKELRQAWALALEPYAYEDVKAAAILYVTKNKYFPDLADLTGGITSAKREDIPVKSIQEIMSPPILAMVLRHVESCRDAEIPTATEAKKQGMSFDAWCLLAESKGV